MNAVAAEVLAETSEAEVEKFGQHMTLEEWADMDEDEPGELVDGQLVEEEVPSNLHEVVVAWLIRTLGNWGVLHRALVLGSEHKLGLTPRRGRKPDVCMYSPGMRLREAAMSRRPPLLIIEVVSRRPRDVKRDRHEKRSDYAKFGVKHYWLVDPDARVIEFLALGPNGRWNDAWSASDGLVDIPGFEGLTLDLDQLWAEAESFIDNDEEVEIEGGES